MRNGLFQILGNNLMSIIFTRKKMYIAFHPATPHLGRESGPEKRAHQHIRGKHHQAYCSIVCRGKNKNHHQYPTNNPPPKKNHNDSNENKSPRNNPNNLNILPHMYYYCLSVFFFFLVNHLKIIFRYHNT